MGWGWAKWHGLPVASTEFVFIFFLSDSSRKQSVIIHTGAWDGLCMREYKSYIILFAAKNILRVCAQGDYYC